MPARKYRLARPDGFFVYAFCTAALLSSTSAIAQVASDAKGKDETGDIVVTGARGVARDLSSLPLSISILDGKDLATQVGVQPNLTRALSLTTPGFNLIGDNLDSGGSIGTQLRGRDTLTVVNGIPINTLFFGAGVDLANFDPEAIGRIEVIRAASAAYGFGANGGIIAVTTKRPEEDGLAATSKVTTEIMTEGSHDNLSYMLYQDLMGKSDAGAFRIGFSYRNNGTAYSARGQVIPSDFSYYNKNSMNLDLYGRVNIDDQQKIEVTGNYFRQTWSDPQYATIDDTCVPELASPTGEAHPCLTTPRSRTDVLSGQPIGAGRLAVPRQRFLLGGVTYTNDDILGSTLTGQAFYTNLHWTFTGYSYEDDGFRDPRTGALIANGLVAAQAIANESRLGGRVNIDTPIGKNGARVLWGYDFLRYSQHPDIANGTIPEDLDAEITGSPDIVQISHAIFAQGQVPFGQFTFSAGVRREWIHANLSDYRRDYPFYELFVGGRVSYQATTFNAGVIWRAAPGLDLYTGFSQGYDVTDLARGAFSVMNASQLRPAPAKATIYELGTRYRSKLLSASLAAFYSDSKNGNRLQATYNEDGDLVNSVVIRQPRRIRGIEATFDLRPAKSLTLGGTVAWQEGNTDDDLGNHIPLDNYTIAPLKLTGYISYQVLPWLNLRAQSVYTGQRTFADAVVGEDGRGPVRSIFLSDVLAVASFGRHEVQLGVANLFNRFYIAPQFQALNIEGYGVNAAPGRTVQLSYKTRW